jgi:hypothetical protein
MSGADFYDSLFGPANSAYMERLRLGRLIDQAAWGGDSGALNVPARRADAMPGGGRPQIRPVEAPGRLIKCLLDPGTNPTEASSPCSGA